MYRIRHGVLRSEEGLFRIASRLRWTSRVAVVIGAVGAFIAFGNAEESAASRVREGPKTVIQSRSLEMRSSEVQNYFLFRDEVRVEGTNLLVTCNLLEVVALREEVDGDPDATIGQFGAIESIVAIGNVEIRQSERRAQAGRAQVLPHEGQVILTEGPRVYDGQGEVSGWKITLLRDEQRALVETDPDRAEDRVTIVLSELPDLGYKDEEMAESIEEEENGDGDGGGEEVRP